MISYNNLVISLLLITYIDVTLPLSNDSITIDGNNTDCDNSSCVSKCCPLDYLLLDNACIHKNETLKLKVLNLNLDFSDLPIYYNDTTKKTAKNFFKDFDTVFVNEQLQKDNCKDEYEDAFIMESGEMRKEFRTVDQEIVTFNYQALKYCVDIVIHRESNTGPYEASYVFYTSCTEDEGTSFSNFYNIVRIVSCVFMTLVLIVYCILRDLRNIQGLVLMAYTGSQLVTFITILIMRNIELSSRECTIITMIYYIACLGSLFWLNIMSIDIVRTMRASKLCQKINRKQKLLKFAKYAVYGWGLPLAMTIAGFLVDQNIEDDSIRPGFDSCFSIELSMWYYVYIPMAIIVIINTLLFIFTAYTLWVIREDVNRYGRKDNQCINRNTIYMNLKLSLLMGLSWSLELITASFPVTDIYDWISVILNLYNACIGILIFIVFVCQRTVLTKLCVKFNISNAWVQRSNTKTTTTVSTSSKSTARQTSRMDSYTDK